MRKTLFCVMCTCLVVNFVGDGNEAGVVDYDFIDADARPVYAGDFGGLGDDGGGDFVAEGTHCGAGRPNEDDSVFQLGETFGEFGVFGCVAPELS
jgi:hypothetical protein